MQHDLWQEWVESGHSSSYHLAMDELRLIWFPIWLAACWAAFAFRPEWLRTAGQSGPVLKRLGASLLGLIFCFSVASMVVVVAVFVSGLARGIG